MIIKKDLLIKKSILGIETSMTDVYPIPIRLYQSLGKNRTKKRALQKTLLSANLKIHLKSTILIE